LFISFFVATESTKNTGIITKDKEYYDALSLDTMRL